MIPWLVAAFAIPASLGFLIVSLLWPRSPGTDLFLKAVLSLGYGLGISSVLTFLWLVSLGSPSRGILLVEIGFCLVLIAGLGGRIRKGASEAHGGAGSQRPFSLKSPQSLWLAFALASVAALLAFIIVSLESPHGGWDAWSIWNLRARFIFRGGASWRTAFTGLLEWAHPDYPLLLSGGVVHGWVSLGRETVLVPILLALGFTLSVVGLAVASLVMLRGKAQGALAGLVLLGTPFLVTHGASQYADVPVACYYLAALVLWSHATCSPNSRPGCFFLAGLSAGLSAWTKNEGLIFLIAMVLASMVTLVRTPDRKRLLKGIGWFAAGAFPLLAVIGYFKFTFAPPNDLLAGQGLGPAIGRLHDLSRYGVIFRAFAVEGWRFGEWVVPALPLLGIYLLLLGIRVPRGERTSVAVLSLALGFTFLGYFFVYAMTLYDLEWQLSKSLDRLLLQLWPAAVYLFFLIARPPDSALAAQAES